MKPHYRLSASGSVTMIGDGMQNVLTGLGGASDKGASNRHVLHLPSDYELTVAYEMSWVAGQIVDIPVDDATRRWRYWNGEQSARLEGLEEKLGIQGKVADAAKSARLYGGSAIIVGAGSENAAEPLDYSTVTDIRYVNVLDRFDITPGPIITDVTSVRFGRPEYYTANIGGRLERIHPSRLCVFRGRKPSSRSFSTAISGWANSVLINKMDAVRDIDAVMATIRSLIAEAKIDVIKTPDLTKRVMDPRQEEALRAQLALVEQTIGNRRKMILDTEEDLMTSSYQFAGLADMVDRFMQMAAGAADIPATRLFGLSPGGLNSTGESDLSNYYDSVAAMQANYLSPALTPLDMCLKATVGELDNPDTKATWRPVKQLSEQAAADVQSKTIAALVALAGTQLFADEDMAFAIAENARRVGITGLEDTLSAIGDDLPASKESTAQLVADALERLNE